MYSFVHPELFQGQLGCSWMDPPPSCSFVKTDKTRPENERFFLQNKSTDLVPSYPGRQQRPDWPGVPVWSDGLDPSSRDPDPNITTGPLSPVIVPDQNPGSASGRPSDRDVTSTRRSASILKPGSAAVGTCWTAALTQLMGTESPFPGSRELKAGRPENRRAGSVQNRTVPSPKQLDPDSGTNQDGKQSLVKVGDFGPHVPSSPPGPGGCRFEAR